MPYLVPVPPISMPIANDSYDREEEAFAMGRIICIGLQR
jgi:hypothetical protein